MTHCGWYAIKQNSNTIAYFIIDNVEERLKHNYILLTIMYCMHCDWL